MTDELFEITLDEKIACIRRELGYRERVYPHLVMAGKMSREKSVRELEIMRKILLDYEAQALPTVR